MKFLLFFFAAFPLSAFASDTCALLPTLREQLELAYFNRHSIPDYIPGLCPSNIHKLTEHLSEAKIDLSRAEALYLYRRDAEGHLDSVWPSSSRNWNGRSWAFHVVMNFAGMILDLDYATPTLEPIDTYFEKMFRSGEKENAGLLVKAIGAQEFLPAYYLNYAQNPKSFLDADTDSLYPPMSLASYLANHPASRCLDRNP